MRTLGILGGMSSESTHDYYRRLNQGVNHALGGHHAARVLIHSVDLHDVFTWLRSGREDLLGEHLADAAAGLEGAGAELVLMACNTAHVVAPEVEARLRVPFLHIADVLGKALREAGHRRVALLGSLVTVEAPFYAERLREFGIETMVPETVARQEVDRIIHEELCFRRILEGSRRRLITIAENLAADGAEAVVLGCTELGLLIDTPTVAGLPVLDTTVLHSQAAVDWALADIAEESREHAA